MRPEIVIHRGELVSPSRLRVRGLLFVLPGLAWVAAFLAIPCLALLAVAFAQRGDFGGIEWSFSFENIRRLAGYDLFGWSPDNLMILGRSFWVAFVSVAQVYGAERVRDVIRTPDGRTVWAVQIAGLIARRIVCWVMPGMPVRKGERVGIICFGSRVDVYLPVDSTISVGLKIGRAHV